MIDTSILGIALTVVSMSASILFLLAPRMAARARGRRVIRNIIEHPQRPEARSVSGWRLIDRVLSAVMGHFDLSGQNFDRRVHIIRRLRRAGVAQKRANLFILARVLSPLVLGVAAPLYVHLIHGFGLWQAFAFAVPAGVAGYWMPNLWLANAIERRQIRIRRHWPDALDLLQICVRSGLALDAALTKVAQELRVAAPDIAQEFLLTVSELNYLQSRRAALENLADRTNLQPVREVVTALIQTQQYGSSIAATLQVLAKENRAQRFSAAERKAAALPPQLTVPMVLFFLPALFAVIIAPAFISFVS